MIAAKVLFESDALLAVDKPPGVTVIPGRDAESAPSLKERLERERGESLWVVHRLDRDTSGVLLFARTAKAHRTLSMAFEAGKIAKTYWALVAGGLEGARRIDVPLFPARRGRMRPGREGEEGGKDARTDVTPLEVLGTRATWVEARPVTGRTHQIRVHLLAVGHPLLFDHQYGQKTPLTRTTSDGASTEVVLARTPLHAARIALRALDGISDLDLAAPMPEDMARAMAFLRTQQ